jgi:hypothetical protein
VGQTFNKSCVQLFPIESNQGANKMNFLKNEKIMSAIFQMAIIAGGITLGNWATKKWVA